MEKGKILQVNGAVIDVVFPEGELPHIYTALNIEREGQIGRASCRERV